MSRRRSHNGGHPRDVKEIGAVLVGLTSSIHNHHFGFATIHIERHAKALECSVQNLRGGLDQGNQVHSISSG